MSALRPGDHIVGRYLLLEELGEGGMGVVFRARDEQTGRDVAVKILRFTTHDASRRLQREARATGGLDPSRVARVFDVGETSDGAAFLAMEYVEGRTLRDLVRGGSLDRAEALRILREIARTLGQAHAAGLVHRDVKPDNVMVRPDGPVVLLDFGIAKRFEPGVDAAQVTTQLTAEGMIIGTPAYLAPEQALGRDIGPAVDQFALAVTAYELLTGKLPWSATDSTSMLAQILAAMPPAASTVNPAVPAAFDGVLQRGLAKSPEARFPTTEAFTDALAAAERGEAVTSISPKPWRSWRATAVFAALVAVSGASLLVRARSPVAHEDAPPSTAPAALAVSAETPLACPVFAIEGAPEIASRLGAAASSLACLRAMWYLGGSSERVLVPAALLGVPVEPRQDVPDVFEASDVRARTLAVAKERGLPSLDGTVTRSRNGWSVDLFVRAADGTEVAKIRGIEATYFEDAIRTALDRLWHQPPLAPAVIDPEIARWTAFPDIEAGLLELDMTQPGSRACERATSRGPALGKAYDYLMSAFCDEPTPPPDGGAPVPDESSAVSLATSLRATTLADRPVAEMRRLATKLASFRAVETSHCGRAILGDLEGMFWASIGEYERAHTAMLSSVMDEPLFENPWFWLVGSARDTGSVDMANRVAAAWFPQEPDFMRSARSRLSDALNDRVREGQLAYILEPTNSRIAALGAALAEAGRADEVRVLTAVTPLERSAPDPSVTASLLGDIDLRDARFARALGRFEDSGRWGENTLPALARLLGRSGESAARWATMFLQLPDAKARDVVGKAAPIALCMNAGGSLAGRCLARVEKNMLGSTWGAGGDLFLRGAKRFVAGDLRGAVDSWRPVVASPSDDLVLLLPTEIFERAGEHDLAARIDARKMRYRPFAGVSEAAPREALRAADRGDVAHARELAKAVVEAWEVADTSVPAVAEMRALLAKIGD